MWCASLFGLEIPAEVASAITIIIAFAAGYIRPQGSWSPRD
jgi:hypothetical protein